MSLQPSLPSDNKDIDNNKWQAFVKLAELLSSPCNLDSQLAQVIRLFNENFSCKTNLWLAPSFLDQVGNGGMLINGYLLSELSPLMEQANRERQAVYDLRSYPKGNVTPLGLAIPLIIQDEILGVLQLERTDQPGFASQDVELITGLVSQFASGLYYFRQKIHNEQLQRNIDRLTSIEEISRSILSNLDRDSLLNSLISLIYQKLGFFKVNIVTVQGDDKKSLKQIGISQDGIEPEKIYDYENDNGPIAWSILHMERVVINNVSLDDRFANSNIENKTKSELAIPLISGELLVGVLDLCSETAQSFDPDSIKAFQLLADNTALAIRNAKLHHSEQVRGMIPERLQRIIGALSVDVTLDDILDDLLKELEELLPWEASAIWLVDTSDDTGVGQFISQLRLAATRINERYRVEIEKSHPINTNELLDQFTQNSGNNEQIFSRYPWLTEIISTGTSGIRKPTSSYEPLGAMLDYKNDYSALGIPLSLNGHPAGMIILVHHEPGIYNVDSQMIITTFADYASIAIENTRLYEAAHDQAWISTVLLQITEAIQSITNLDELLETIVTLLPGLIGIEACTVFLWDQSIEAFFPQASNGFDAEQFARMNAWEIYPGSVIAFDQLKASNSPVILDNDTLSEQVAAQVFPDYDFQKDLLILFPLSTQNDLCGALLIDFTNSNLDKNSSQQVWDEKYTLIQGAAHQAASAIENLQLIKSQEEEAYISVALLQVAQAVVSLNQLEEILGTIVRITPILVGVKRCIIYLWDNKEQLFRQSQYFGFSKNDLTSMGQDIKADEFPFIQAIQQNNAIIYQPLEQENSPLSWSEIETGDYHMIEGIENEADDEVPIKLDERSLHSRQRLLIGFPLSVKDEILGVMLIEEEDAKKGSPSLHIREKRIEIVKGITQQAAIAIKNELLQQEAVKSERMERELQLAKEIQTTFLPEILPELPGWDIDARWQPARQVAGDFYDIMILDEDRIGFVIADVADKGMPAALFMTLIRTLIRAAAKEKSSPADVLKQVNELLMPDTKHGMFVTVFYAIFSLNSGKVVYANAGHNPPVIKPVNQNELIELTRTSIALGIFNDIEVAERELFMNLGDWMFLYTDGITEAFSSEDEAFGKQRLYDLLMEHEFAYSTALLDLIERSVFEFIDGAEISDDITLAVILRKPT